MRRSGEHFYIHQFVILGKKSGEDDREREEKLEQEDKHICEKLSVPACRRKRVGDSVSSTACRQRRVGESVSVVMVVVLVVVVLVVVVVAWAATLEGFQK